MTDNIAVRKVIHVLTKAVEMSLFLLERTWMGSVVEAIIGKALVASSLFVWLRYLKQVQINYASVRKTIEHPSKTSSISSFPLPRSRNITPSKHSSRSPESSPFDFS